MREKSRGGEEIHYNLRSPRITGILYARLRVGLPFWNLEGDVPEKDPKADPPSRWKKGAIYAPSILHVWRRMIRT